MTHDLIATQLRLEAEMTKSGIDRYMKTVMEAKQKGTEDKLQASQTLMQHHTGRMSAAIAEWMEGCKVGVAGNRNVAYKYLKGMDPDVLAFITLKRLLGRVSTPKTVQGGAVDLGTSIEDEFRLQSVREQERKLYNSILEGVKKRSSDHYKRVYALRRADEALELDSWPKMDLVHIGMRLIDIAVQTLGWFSLEHRQTAKNKTQIMLTSNPALLAEMESNHSMTALLRPVYEPMVIEPRDWTTPKDGGYLSSSIRPLKLVKITSKGYYEELANTEMPVVYSAVNALQRTAWQVNTDVREVLAAFWEMGHDVAGLPARTGQEIPTKPHDIDTNEEARTEWRGKAAKAHLENTEERSKRTAVIFTLDVSGRYAEFDSIYMPYVLDFRGRIYAVPAFNPQGPDFMKALLRFSNGKPLGENGATWLAMHGANVAGNDKCSLENRVQWVLDNEEEIIRCGTDPYEYRGWYTGINGQRIDKPWQFLAFCMEWKGYSEQGESFVSKLAIALDGSCSGIQHFSAMLRDEVGGAAVNLVPSDKPMDVYGLVSGKVTVALKAIVASEPSPSGEDDQDRVMAQQWLDFGVNRKVTKRPVMTLAYGSRKYGFKFQLLTDILEPAQRAASREGSVDTAAFPFTKDGFQAAGFMAGKIWDAVTVTLVKAVEAMNWLQSAALLASAERSYEEADESGVLQTKKFSLPIRWASPVGFPVLQAYWDMAPQRVKTSLQGKIMKVTLGEPTDRLDTKAQANGISPNFIHSCDAAHMMLTTVRATQEGINSFAMIHDSFGTTAAETETLFRVVRESFVEMYTEVDVFGQFRDELVRQLPEEALADLPPLPQRGTLDLKGVLDSRFCFA